MKLVDIEPYKGKVIANHLYSGVTKLIEVDSLKEITEKDIVKPYLTKVKEEAEKLKQYDNGTYNCTFDRLIALDNVIQFIDNLLEEVKDLIELAEEKENER